MADYSGRKESKVPQALLVYPDRRPDWEPKKPMIAVLDSLVEYEGFEDLVRKIILFPQTVVHEYSHYLDRYQNGKGQGYSSRWEAMEDEFTAFISEEHYALHQGYTEEWNRGQLSPYGWPGYLRGLVEQNYFRDPVEPFVKPD